MMDSDGEPDHEALDAEVVAVLRTLFDDHDDDAAGMIYRVLRTDHRRLRGQRLISYWCALRHCLLLDVVQIPGHVILHQPRCRFSPEVNENLSVPEARAKYTVDGERRWIAQTFAATGQNTFTLNCDHLLGHNLSSDDVEGDLGSGHREISISSDGSRAAVR